MAGSPSWPSPAAVGWRTRRLNRVHLAWPNPFAAASAAATMTRARAARWLLFVWTLAGCASAASPPERTTKATAQAEPARPKVEVTTEAAPGPGPTAPSGPLSVGPAQPAEPPLVPPPAPVAPEPPSAPPVPPPTVEALPAPSAPATPTPRRQIVLNFDNADVEVVVQAAAEIVGFNYVLGPGARGRKITVQTMGKISSDEVFPVLLTILDVNGLAAVRSGSLYRIIPREGAPQTSVKTIVGRDVGTALPADEVVTQIVPLQFIGAPDAVTLLRSFVPQPGALAAHRETNLLLITDTAANIRRILDILRLVDVEVALSELQIIPLKHADALELAQLLIQLFASGRLGVGPTGVGPSAPAPAPALPPAPGAPAGAPRPPFPGGEVAPGGEGPLIVPERRSNSLVVHARKQAMETIRRLIEKLDVDIYGGQRVFVYFAENTKAKDLATTLDAIYGRGDRGPSITGTQPSLRAPSISGAYGVAATSAPAAPLAPPLSPAPSPGVGPRPAGTGFPGLAGEAGLGMVEIRFIADEVTLTDDTKLGIEWAIRTGRFDLNSAPSGTLPSRPPQSLIPFGGLVPPGFNFFTFAADKVLAALNALATENKVNVLSNPSIMTTENKKAVINVSTSVPIVTS